MASPYGWHLLGQGLNAMLPVMGSFRLAQRLAIWHGRWSLADRNAVRANLTAITNWPASQVEARLDEVFANFGRYLVEFFNAHRLSQIVVTHQGAEHLIHATAGNRGAILLAAHVGNWELGAVLLRRMGWRVTVVALSHRDRRINQRFEDARSRCGVETLPLGEQGTAQRCLQALSRGYLVGLVGDRAFGTKGIEVRLFDRQMIVPRGPALLSLRSGAALVPTFFIRETPWHFRLITEEPIWPSEHHHIPQLLHTLSQHAAAAIERVVRRVPTQWLMFQSLDQLAQGARMPRPGAAASGPAAAWQLAEQA